MSNNIAERWEQVLQMYSLRCRTALRLRADPIRSAIYLHAIDVCVQ